MIGPTGSTPVQVEEIDLPGKTMTLVMFAEIAMTR